MIGGVHLCCGKNKRNLRICKETNIMAKKLNKLPGVLSFQRCLLVTDGLFYNELDNGNLSPLWVIRHGIR